MATQAEKKTWLDLIIDSDEELGVLATDYLEDYYGVDGHLTLVHTDTSEEFDIVMNEVAGGGPYDHDHFEGTRDASTMPLGAYEIRGRARDLLGNYTIITAVETPLGGERVITLGFDLIESSGIIYIVFNSLKRPVLDGPVLQRPTLNGIVLQRPQLSSVDLIS